MSRLAVLFLAALLLVPVARASNAHPTQAELEGEVRAGARTAARNMDRTLELLRDRSKS